MDPNTLEVRLTALTRARVAVFGDFCLDAYWLIPDEGDDAEISVETGRPVLRVRSQRYSPGGAGNVAVNLRDLGVGTVRAVGLVGDDLFGPALVRLLNDAGVDTAGMLTAGDWQTMVYAKPCVADDEQSRLDFGAFNAIDADTIDRLAAALDAAAGASDVVILNQQVPAGVSTEAMIERINAVIAAHPACRFIVDARDRPALYRGAMLKLNDAEAARLLDGVAAQTPLPQVGERLGEGDGSADAAHASETNASADGQTLTPALSLEGRGSSEENDATVWRHATALQRRTGRCVFVTRGPHGVMIADDDGLIALPGVPVTGPIDTVGAGDTTISALSAALASGASPLEAARLAMLAASITVTKLKTTGTASPDEVRARAAEFKHMMDLEPAYHPDLADNPDAATYLPGTRIEVVRPLADDLRIEAAVFDHDGTLVTLRRGWEHVMQDVMLTALLGGTAPADVAPDKLTEIKAEIDELIDRTTGIQTLVQMREFLPVIRKYGYVAEADMLDEHGYKGIYVERIREVVRRRVEAMNAGDIDRDAVMIRGVEHLLDTLKARGLKLYLTSGSDEPDIRADAELLGLDTRFTDIRGAVGDVNVEAKRIVLDKLINDLGDGRSVVVFGDGPVEIREGGQRGATTVGIASDEDHPGELSVSKRRRLIHAGAHLIIADYSEVDALLEALGIA
ncbi:MAG: HAD family hydrolase [Phycisphaera sp.]|nr:HAD family hydrolase [Phycisphaera sp.]